MMLNRLRLALCAALLSFIAAPHESSAQGYPTQPVRLLIGYAPCIGVLAPAGTPSMAAEAYGAPLRAETDRYRNAASGAQAE